MTRTKPDGHYVQSAVIPYRIREDRVEILLISSRKRKRWVVPKGIREPHLSAAESAAKEAAEEAGLSGRVAAEPVGRYRYRKWGGVCHVEVFAMQVSSALAEWPEDFRDRKWLAPEAAARRVDEPRLQQLILKVARQLDPRQVVGRATWR